MKPEYLKYSYRDLLKGVTTSPMGTKRSRRGCKATGIRIQWTMSLDQKLININEWSLPFVRGYLRRIENLWRDAHPELPPVMEDTLSRRARRLGDNSSIKTWSVLTAPTLEERESVVAAAEGVPGLCDRLDSQCTPHIPCDHHEDASHNPPETSTTTGVVGTVTGRRTESTEMEREIADELRKSSNQFWVR